MKDKNFLRDLTEHLCNAVPEHLKNAKKDLTHNFHTILQNAFNQFDLVTREEFDAQTKVLARSRKKMTDLEKRIAELEILLSEKKK